MGQATEKEVTDIGIEAYVYVYPLVTMEMTRRVMTSSPLQNSDAARATKDFSLVLGGPLYQLLLRAGLVRASMDLVHRRLVACAIVAWLPLAALTALAGTFVGRAVEVPFLFDLSANIRFLISLPLLIGAGVLVHRRMRVVVGEFLERELIAPEDRPRFETMIAQAMRLRNSTLIEVLVLLLSFMGGYWLWRGRATVPVATWYAIPADGSINFTGAGYWYAFVSLPILRFLVMRWHFRVIVWYVFLWRVSRLRLKLNPLHPDRAGGLGFLEQSVIAFAPVLTAQSAFLAGVIADQVLHAGATLPHFKFEIAGFVALQILMVLLPLLFFVPQLIEAEFAGSREFGVLAGRYADDFRRKWIEGHGTSGEELLGSGDIQSLADIANSFEVVRTMRRVPFEWGLVARLAILIGLPLLPLTLTMIPLDELVQRVFRLLW